MGVINQETYIYIYIYMYTYVYIYIYLIGGPPAQTFRKNCFKHCQKHRETVTPELPQWLVHTKSQKNETCTKPWVEKVWHIPVPGRLWMCFFPGKLWSETSQRAAIKEVVVAWGQSRWRSGLGDAMMGDNGQYPYRSRNMCVCIYIYIFTCMYVLYMYICLYIVLRVASWW